jgi:hypothetical protein
MQDKERYDELCKPAFAEIRSDLDLLKKHLIVGNGKPSLLTRVEMLEVRPKSSPDGRTVRIGKLVELRGYGLNDVVRAAVLLGILWLLYLNITERLARNGIAGDLKRSIQAAAVATKAGNP